MFETNNKFIARHRHHSFRTSLNGLIDHSYNYVIVQELVRHFS